MAKGIDVYTRYQRVYNWHQVRAAGYEWVYIKVSDGNANRPDNGYAQGAKAATMKAGAYHYAQPGDPIAQANRLADRAEQIGATDLAPALDLEHPFVPSRAAIDFAIRFLLQIRARGHRPCLYANNAMLKVILGPVRAAVPEVIVWAARYGAEPSVPYDVWQHSQHGHVPGISAGSVDLNQGAIPLNRSAAPPSPTPEEDMPSVLLPPGEYASATIVVPKSATEVVVSLGFGPMEVHGVYLYGGAYSGHDRNHKDGKGGCDAYTQDPDRPRVIPVPPGTLAATIWYSQARSERWAAFGTR
ncbi:glycoside hydrolase family 25 protein [Amycolatopsis anabasis]|uniref:glycoside hydrolase family 25 protein n=1 Tax=Amycolatopsis anabasis TaxID=1840409 RepID=UPI00131E9280|nr:glycoside hydrolase family 25 protein [Amycolatopsis anabasis]